MKKLFLIFGFFTFFIIFSITTLGNASYCINNYMIPSYQGKTFTQTFKYGEWNVTDLKNDIDNVLKKYNIYSKPVSKLLIGTAAIETYLGKYHKHPVARGLFQIETDTLQDAYEYLISKNDTYLNLYSATIWDNVPLDAQLKQNFEFQIICAYLIYIRKGVDVNELSLNINNLSNIWKNKWNTYKGKGSSSEFIDRWKEINDL